jgi:hypothetical protein
MCLDNGVPTINVTWIEEKFLSLAFLLWDNWRPAAHRASVVCENKRSKMVDSNTKDAKRNGHRHTSSRVKQLWSQKSKYSSIAGNNPPLKSMEWSQQKEIKP